MDFLENLNSVFTAAVVPAGASVYRVASAVLLEGFGFIRCSWPMKQNLRLLPHVMELVGLLKWRTWVLVMLERTYLLASLAFSPRVSAPQHKLPAMLVIWEEFCLQNKETRLNWVFLKYFGEMLGSKVTWRPTSCIRCRRGHVPKSKVCLAYDACAALGNLSFKAVIAKLAWW